MSRNYTVGNAKAILKAQRNKLEKHYLDNTALKNLVHDDQLAILNMSEDLALAIREVYDHPNYAPTEYPAEAIERYEELLKMCGVIGFSPEGYFRMVVPLLVNRRRKRFGYSNDSFNDLIVRERKKGHLPKVSGKQCFMYKNYTGKMYTRNRLDNDNVEAQHLTNAVCRGLQIADNPDSAMFVYCSVKSSFEMTELTVVPEKDLSVIGHILACDVPEVYDKNGKIIEIPI